MTGQSLGGFVLRDLVGAGGYGDVYLADQTALGREAVVKVLRSGATDEVRVQRFLREAQLASRLDHPYAAHIYAFGAEPEGVFWIAMERVRGASLRDVLEAQGPMPLDRFIPLLERICEVVHTAHEAGIVHRDLKPDNVMVISRAGRQLPKLLDFGIARAADMPLLPVAPDATPREVTATSGSMLGSPPYMAPEVWVDAHAAGPPADQYALAALAYEALTGRLAFPGRTVRAIMRAHARPNIAPLGDGFPAELDAALRRGMARKAGDRFANVLELALAVRAASGLGSESAEIPQLDEDLRTRYVARAPQPLADAVAAYDAAKNAHQAREALRGIVRISAWYVGLLALACRTRTAPDDTPRARELLRDLRRQGLAPAGWIALARQLVVPFVRLPDTYPLPELVLALQGNDAFAPALEGSLAESLPDSSDDAATQSIARELPVVTTLLRAFAFLLDYELVVARAQQVESWTGVRAGAKRVSPPRAGLPVNRPSIVDDTGAPLLVVWPLMQLGNAVPGHGDELFMLAGPGRAGARLVSSPQGFEHRDDDLWDWFRTQLHDDTEGTAREAASDSPYRGLAAYTGDDTALFFGRERETEAVVNRFKLESFVAIVGPSGVGKSSFVHAGVAPALGCPVVSMRPGRAPKLPALEPGTLLVVDQFEELFTLGVPADERDAFARALLDAKDVKIAITLRDDFLIRAEQLPGFAHALARGLQLLGPLGADALERIVVEPARRAGYEFDDPKLPAKMVAEVADTPSAVALISFTATRLWELRDRHFHQLSRKSYDAIGGVAGALARHADETVEQMPAGERALVRTAFRHLVTFEGTRAVLERDELVGLLGGGTDADRAIERLLAARLLATRDSERGGSVEIVHETLVTAWPRLAEWRREDSEGSRFHEQLRAAARQWEDRGRPRGLLWRGDALAEYQLWRKRTSQALAPGEAAFGAASESDAARGRRIRRALLAGAFAITAAFVVVLLRANRQAQDARGDAEVLLRESYVEQARLMTLAGDKLGALPALDSAIALGEDSPGVRLMRGEAARSQRARLFDLQDATDKLWDVQYSPDGTKIATASTDHQVRIYNADTGALLATIPRDEPVHAVAFDRSGALLATAGSARVVIWDVALGRPLTTITAADSVGGVTWGTGDTLLTSGKISQLWHARDGTKLGEVAGRAKFCADGETILVFDRSTRFSVLDATLAEQRRFEIPNTFVYATSPDASVVAIGTALGELDVVLADGTVTKIEHAHSAYIEAIAVAPSGRIVTGSDDHTAKLWDGHSGKLLATFPNQTSNVSLVRFSPAEDMVLTGTADGNAYLWRTTPVVALAELIGHTKPIFAGAFRADGKRIATASWDHHALVWDVDAATSRVVEPTFVDDQFDEVHRHAAFDPSGRRLALATVDGALVVTSVDGDHDQCRVASGGRIDRIAWNRDGRLLATSNAGDHAIAVRDARTCEVTYTTATDDTITGLAFDARDEVVAGIGPKLAIVSRDRVDVLGRLPAPIFDVGTDPDGGRVWVDVLNPPTLAVWDIATRQRQDFTGFAESPTVVLFDPARHRVIAGDEDQHVWVWDDTSARVLASVEANGPIYDLATDGDTIVAGGGLAPIVIDAQTLQPTRSLVGHHDLVGQVATLGAHLFATRSQGGTVFIWDTTRGKAVLAFHDTQSILSSPDHRTFAIAEVGGTRIWSRADR